MYRKNLLVIISLAIITTIAGFGCKGLTAAQKAATKPVVLEYWTVYDDVDALQNLVAKYRSEGRSYVTVNIKQLRPEELYSRLTEELSEDRGPDIISVNVRSLRQFVSKLSPMPASVSDTTVITTKSKLGDTVNVDTTNISLPSTSQIDQEYVPTVKKDVVVDGKIYGLPLSLDTMAIYYNKDLLDRANIPEPPKTWDEFQTVVKKITKYDRNTSSTNNILQSGTALGTGNNIPAADDIMYVLYEQSGLSFVSDQNYSTLNVGKQNDTSIAMNVVNFFTDFANSSRDTYCWNEEMDNALDRFISGSVGFYFGYSYNYPTIKARAPQLNLQIMPLFQLNDDNSVNVANYWIQAVPAKSTQPSEAWAFINYITRTSANWDYLDKTNRPTARRAYIRQQEEKPELAPFVGQLLVANNWYRGRNYDGARRAMQDMFHDWVGPVPARIDLGKWRQSILNNAASKINQTL